VQQGSSHKEDKREKQELVKELITEANNKWQQRQDHQPSERACA
jgi:hypothetical protein